MDALISLMQFDVAMIDLIWIFDLIQNATVNFHQGLRAKMDWVLTGCLFVESIGVAFVHDIELAIPLFLILGVLTLWCVAYFLHDQAKILNQRHRSARQ